MSESEKSIAFISLLKKKLSSDLPGDTAHAVLMNYKRITPTEVIASGKNPKESAVLILLFKDKEEWNFVLTKRKEYEGVHSKQISLPGGKKEYNETPEETALRETQEEIGVKSEDVKIIGSLTNIYIPPSNFIVCPIVGYMDYKPNFVLEEKEVAQLFCVPVNALWETNVVKRGNVKVRGMEINVSYFDLEDEVVWGATAMILSEFREVFSLGLNKV